MAIRNWKAQSIAGLWVAWVFLGVVVMWFGRSRHEKYLRTNQPDGSNARPLSDSDEVVVYYLFKEASDSTHPDSLRRRALLGLLKDSSSTVRASVWQALDLPATLSKEQKDSVAGLAFGMLSRVLTPVAQAFQDAGPKLLLITIAAWVLIAGPPLILTVITLRWYIPRVIVQASTKGAV